MPYDSINSLPEYVKKYSAVIQRQFMHVFNTTYKTTKDEKRAFMAANSILKKRISRGKESHSDYFSFLIDSYLNNLSG